VKTAIFIEHTDFIVCTHVVYLSFSGICIYVKKSCEPGPFLKQAKIAGIPSVIGPAGPNIVLRQLVEQIVLSAHSSKEVLKLLASETDKMTIASILKVFFCISRWAFSNVFLGSMRSLPFATLVQHATLVHATLVQHCLVTLLRVEVVLMIFDSINVAFPLLLWRNCVFSVFNYLADS